MISISGVRGIVGDSLTPAVALRWAEAFGSLCNPGPVVVGGDSRPSKTMMRAAAFAGLSASGCSIIDIGLVPTPTVGLAVRHHRARGGIAITASHNPIEWNAFKFYSDNGFFLGAEEGIHLRKLVESNESFSVAATDIGTYRKDEEALDRHLHRILEIPYLDITALRKRKFRVGLDTVHGAGGLLLSRLLDELGCETVGFHLEPTGMFPRNPEPVATNLRDVCAAMKSANVDIGFVADPDADRLAVILDNGEPAGEEFTLVAAADVALHHVKGSVVANCSTTMALDDIADRYGVSLSRTKVGEAHVARVMCEIGAVIGGEGNGGVMLTAVHPARDSAVAMALILQGLLESGHSATGYFDTLPHYPMIKRRVEFDSLDRLKEKLAGIETRMNFGKADRLDGYRWKLNGAWLQIRASNTEPIIRILAEARTENEAHRLVKEAEQAFR